MVNDSTGIIRTVAGNGSKQLTAQLDNRGLLQLNEDLTLARALDQRGIVNPRRTFESPAPLHATS